MHTLLIRGQSGLQHFLKCQAGRANFVAATWVGTKPMSLILRRPTTLGNLFADSLAKNGLEKKGPCMSYSYAFSLLTVAIFAEGHSGSSVGCSLFSGQHRLAQGAALSSVLASCDGMGPGQGQATDERAPGRDGGRGGGGVGPPEKAANPHPRLKARPSRTGRGVELHMWV